jgi:hypothetical protein
VRGTRAGCGLDVLVDWNMVPGIVAPLDLGEPLVVAAVPAGNHAEVPAAAQCPEQVNPAA